MVFCDDIWTAGPQPVLCAAQRCSLCVLTAVLLKDESGGQLAITLKEE